MVGDGWAVEVWAGVATVARRVDLWEWAVDVWAEVWVAAATVATGRVVEWGEVVLNRRRSLVVLASAQARRRVWSGRRRSRSSATCAGNVH